MLGQLGRAAWPVLPAVALVLALRAVEGGDRTLAMALGELALYVAAVVAVTMVAGARAAARGRSGTCGAAGRVVPVA